MSLTVPDVDSSDSGAADRRMEEAMTELQNLFFAEDAAAAAQLYAKEGLCLNPRAIDCWRGNSLYLRGGRVLEVSGTMSLTELVCSVDALEPSN